MSIETLIRAWSRERVLPALAVTVLVGCSDPPVGECSLVLNTTGAVAVAFKGEVDCEGFGPLDGLPDVSASYERDFTEIYVRADFVKPGDTGSFEGIVQITERGEKWSKAVDTPCTIVLDEHEEIEEGEGVYQLEGTATCAQPLEPFIGNDSMENISFDSLTFAAFYTDLSEP